MIKLNVVEFERLQQLTKKPDNALIAEYIGVSQSTVWRIKKGKMLPGNEFISAVLKKFPELKFEDIFFVA